VTRRHGHLAAALGLWLFAFAAPAAGDDVQRSIRAASRFYESLDYDPALEQLARARKLGPRPDEEVEIALYEGIIYADMSGHRDQSQAAFRAALLLRPDARLPVKVSPKVEREFEQLRKQVAQELARTNAKRSTRPPTPPAGDRPVAATPPPTPSLVPAAAPPPAPAAAPGPSMFGARVPLVPAALGGVAVAAGVGGTVFGLMTRSSLDQAQRATYQDEAYAHWQDATRSAPVANTLFVAAGALACGAVATYFLLPHE
jgi:hypothetical protein